MTVRERWGLRGPVRSCRIERSWGSGGDARHDSAVLDFRRDGALVSHWHQNPDGSSWETTHEYDELGRLLRVRTGNAPADHRIQTYEYNEEGRLSRIMERGHDGRERIAESYEYDATGRKQKTCHIDVTLQLPNTHYAWGIDGSDTAVSVPNAATITTVYNEREQPIQATLRDDAGTLLVRAEFAYDEAGHLVEERVMRTMDALPPEMRAQMNPAELEAVRAIMGSPSEPARTIHRYDDKGRRVETRSRLFGPLGEHRTAIIYNDHGDPAEEETEDVHREVDIADSGELTERQDAATRHSSKARFDYEYDDRGNWVKKGVEGSSIERRTLVYYD